MVKSVTAASNEMVFLTHGSCLHSPTVEAKKSIFARVRIVNTLKSARGNQAYTYNACMRLTLSALCVHSMKRDLSPKYGWCLTGHFGHPMGCANPYLVGCATLQSMGCANTPQYAYACNTCIGFSSSCVHSM